MSLITSVFLENELLVQEIFLLRRTEAYTRKIEYNNILNKGTLLMGRTVYLFYSIWYFVIVENEEISDERTQELSSNLFMVD